MDTSGGMGQCFLAIRLIPPSYGLEMAVDAVSELNWILVK